MTSAATPTPPVGTPIYGCGYGLAVKRFFAGYVKFKGKASRSEFWRAGLVIGIFVICLAIATPIAAEIVVGSVINDAMSSSSLSDAERTAITTAFIGVIAPFCIVYLALLPPLFAIMARRLRDSGFSPWLAALFFVGTGIIPLVICGLETKNGPVTVNPGYPQQIPQLPPQA